METEIKGILDGIKTTVNSFKTRFDANDENYKNLQRQVDALDSKMQDRTVSGPGGLERKSISDVVRLIQEHPSFEMLQKSGRGRAIIEVPNLFTLESKATITNTFGPYDPERGIAPGGRKLYQLRRIIRASPIETGSVHFVRETGFTDNASPQGGEGVEKAESALTFAGETATVKTIATWTPASKQVLDDVEELGEHIDGSLRYGLEREFEEQCLNGDGTGDNFEGLATTATAFDTSLLVPGDGWEFVDILRLAALQLEEAGYECTAFVIPPRVKARIDLQKNAQGDYINRPPLSEQMQQFLWNTAFIASHAIGSNNFLAGDFATGCHIRMRQESTIDISDSHDDFFIKNKIAIRAEMRAALVNRKPAAFVTGSFSQSPQ